MSLSDELRISGLAVIEPRTMRGSVEGVDEIDVGVTGTGAAHDGAGDINSLGLVDKVVAYIERSGRVWVFAEGPLTGSVARVAVAAYKDENVTDAQREAVSVVSAVLHGFYALSEPEGAGRRSDEDTEGNPAKDEGDDE